jgi:hypothetical protein
MSDELAGPQAPRMPAKKESELCLEEAVKYEALLKQTPLDDPARFFLAKRMQQELKYAEIAEDMERKEAAAGGAE